MRGGGDPSPLSPLPELFCCIKKFGWGGEEGEGVGTFQLFYINIKKESGGGLSVKKKYFYAPYIYRGG